MILSIGKVFGEVVKIGYNTEHTEHGKFARLAVNIGLTKPLVSKVEVDGYMIFVEYEGLPTIFFNCECYGHLKEVCLLLLPSTALLENAPPPPRSNEAASDAGLTTFLGIGC